MKLKIYIFGLFLFFVQFAFSQTAKEKPAYILDTKDTIFVAGTFKSLNFSTQETQIPSLYITNSFGSTLVKAQKVQQYVFYVIPNNISNKRGLVTWSLLENKNTILSGKIHIISDTIVPKIETYVGPPTIQAGGRDFAMSVIIPTDTLDNPVMDHSKIQFKKQFLTEIDTTELTVKNLLAYQKIFSTNTVGRYLLSSNCYHKESTEQTLDVWAALPTDFTIASESNHNYADGNQICKIKSSVITDAYGNIVSDGTSVSFLIRDSNGDILNANGNTINGVATAKLVHPDHQQKWTIKSYVYGMAESNTIELNFEQVIHQFNVEFSKHNREITIGPLKSFMQQMIPDGLRVELEVKAKDKTYKHIVTTSKKGYASFVLDSENYKNETYDFIITTAGISKTFKNKRIW